eukprot:3794639-Amphidinium_carterae.1
MAVSGWRLADTVASPIQTPRKRQRSGHPFCFHLKQREEACCKTGAMLLLKHFSPKAVEAQRLYPLGDALVFCGATSPVLARWQTTMGFPKPPSNAAV